MKSPLFIQKLSGSLQIGFAAMAIAPLAACVSNSWMRQPDSAMPIEAIHSGSGDLISFKSHETSDRLYVSGHIKKSFGGHIPYAAHVDVLLIDTNGMVLAEKQDDIDPPSPRSARSRSGRISYVASFPLSEARQAAKIRIIYHGSAHGKGNS